MRVISGQWKGRALLVSPKFNGRPTTDFAREGLFNVLQNQLDWDGLNVLELFAGTGAFGIECASRGDVKVTALELSRLHVDWIKKNYEHFGIKTNSVFVQDVLKYLGNNSQPTYDLIFADPPFDLTQLSDLPEAAIPWLNQNGIFVLEHPKSYNFELHPGFVKEKKYANVHFSFFKGPELS